MEPRDIERYSDAIIDNGKARHSARKTRFYYSQARNRIIINHLAVIEMIDLLSSPHFCLNPEVIALLILTIENSFF